VKRRRAIAGGFLLLAGATGGAIALSGGLLGAGCTTPPGIGSACGLGEVSDAGDAGDAGDASAYVTLAAFCTQLAQTDCSPAIVKACYGTIADTQTCIDAGAASCFQAHKQASSCNPDCLSYDAEFASACIAAHASIYDRSVASFVVGDYQTLATACQGAFNSGCLQAASCTSDSDCDLGAGLVCVMQSGPMGTCQVPSSELIGSPCTGDPTAQCAEGTYCTDAGKCVMDPGMGAPCNDVTAPCYASVTVTVSPGGAGDAGATGVAGDPCGTGNAGDAGALSSVVNGLLCSGSTGQCVCKRPDGALCGAPGDTDAGDAVCMGGFCVRGLCESLYTFGPDTPPSTATVPGTVTAPGCVYFGVY
jgi:hypothetical protein